MENASVLFQKFLKKRGGNEMKNKEWYEIILEMMTKNASTAPCDKASEEFIRELGDIFKKAALPKDEEVVMEIARRISNINESILYTNDTKYVKLYLRDLTEEIHPIV
ncbi:MAG: hypothetical protein PF549_03365 [Patescibacteria group bacterium]|jgi:hypothetical protein|nr:hypothetical protein [Patescibacteria group bacterium]